MFVSQRAHDVIDAKMCLTWVSLGVGDTFRKIGAWPPMSCVQYVVKFRAPTETSEEYNQPR